MGYGLPAAMGAKLACPDKNVVLFTGDGSIMMNIQELATIADNDIDVKIVIVHNFILGMVGQWQRLFYDGRYSETELADCPDFVKLAEAYGWGAERVADPSQVGQAFRRMLQAEGPYLVDVRIERDQSVFPMVAPGKGISQSMGAIDAAPGKAGAHAQHDDGQEAVRFSAHAPAEGPEIRCQGGATKEARDDR